MRYEDMTKREQLLSRGAVCPMCNEVINKLEDVQLVKIKYGKRVIPFFIHSACLLKTLSLSQLEVIRKEDEVEEIIQA